MKDRFSETEMMIQQTVEAVWSNYDTDGNGFLDRDETFNFVLDSLRSMGQEANLTREAFEEAFAEYDADGTGKISKGEMAAYLKKVSGMWTHAIKHGGEFNVKIDNFTDSNDDNETAMLA